ncbi:MAG: NADH-quinone oxidoreductase subunit 5 family protein [Candidatus Hodarchaeales archaeon]|jgi:NADH-quinone oxidoreductase subunit L
MDFSNVNKLITTLSEAPEGSEDITVEPITFLGGELIWSLSILIPLLPYIAFFVILFIGHRKQNEKLNHYISIGANAIAWIVAMILFLMQFMEFVSEGKMRTIEIVFFDWVTTGDWSIQVGFLIDPLSTIMFTVVSTLALLIQIYGYSYMHGEKGITSGRYNAEISLFVGSMLLLTLSMNHLLFFIGWELMGLCSYLLIGFFLDKEVKTEDKITNAPASAAKKAFMITKLGDIMLMAGFSLLFYFMVTNGVSHPLNFMEIRENTHVFTGDWQALIAILLFGGAVGKSAQFPLHLWLPDAMEGPTTVSALIHSATMVKAGVFLVARNYYLFEGTWAIQAVGFIGSFTAIFAATLAFVADDIKRVLAFSTISQLGYMLLGLGAGSLTGGMFHLISHSFFKCLLFLSAGSLIHAVHSNSMWDMGGLKAKMKKTYWVMLAGSLGLAGIVFFNGFYSKDAVILAALNQYLETQELVYGFMAFAGLITAFLTGFYSFRMVYVVFSGEKTRKEGADPHESDNVMTTPLIVLALVVVISGILSFEGFLSNLLDVFLSVDFNILGRVNIFNEHELEVLLKSWHVEEPLHVSDDNAMFLKGILPFIALGLASLGIFFAHLMYNQNGRVAGGQLSGFPSKFNNIKPVGTYASVLKKRYYIDALFLAIAATLDKGVAEAVRRIDTFMDTIIDGIGRGTKGFCGYARSFDERYIDGTVRALSAGAFQVGQWFRRRQSGVLQNYNRQLFLGLFIILIFTVILSLY